MKQPEMTPTCMVVSKDGGILDVVSAEGEVLFSLPVPAGVQAVRPYLALAPEGAHLEVAEGLVVVPMRRARAVTGYGEVAYQSSANPDFQPSHASELEQMMRAQLFRMQQATTRIERRAAAAEDIERRRAVAEKQAEADLKAQVDAKAEVEPKLVE